MVNGQSVSGDWVRRFHAAPDAAVRLICFPHAGGSAASFFSLSGAVSPAADVLAIQYPGRQDRRHEPCIEDLRKLADAVATQLRPWLDRPVALFGHSMGATLAFEVATTLERDGIVPLSLFASGCRAPSRHRDRRFDTRVDLVEDDTLVAELKRLSGTDQLLLADDQVLRLILPALRADYKAVQTYRYRPGPRLACPIQALVGNEDPQVTIDEARSWAEHTTGAFGLLVFPGGHFYLSSHTTAVTTAISEQITARSKSA